jgi:hypothetical protein
MRAQKVGRKVESRGQQVIRAILIFFDPESTVNSQQSTVNSQQSTSSDGVTGIDITAKQTLLLRIPASQS